VVLFLTGAGPIISNPTAGVATTTVVELLNREQKYSCQSYQGPNAIKLLTAVTYECT
jgi:glycine cleavage system aminomethyltransferase T